MKLLIFEYATALGLDDPSLTVEGTHMLKGLVDDLDNANTSYLISSDSPELKSSSNCTPISINGDLSLWLDENISNYDACLAVAPEEDRILYNITHLLEENNIKVIGSSSEAVLACSDKYRTYQLLEDKFPLINSEKVFFNELKEYKNQMSKLDKMLVKPADGVSCSGVRIVQSYAEFIRASAQIKKTTKLPFFILQDYQKGASASVSVLSTGEKATPISLNRQDILLKDGRLVYNGGEVPYEHRLSDEALELSKNAVKSITGLRGYVGVDLVMDDEEDEIYILEINPRLTTSFVALRRLVNFNLTEAIINASHGRLPQDIEIKGSLTFRKDDSIIFK
ncbi:MAG: ATP-grasp domain-containing protein [Methanobacterium sp.]|nr:ATP-grasp domain-containing protein [Methanobacterium sp.]